MLCVPCGGGVGQNIGSVICIKFNQYKFVLLLLLPWKQGVTEVWCTMLHLLLNQFHLSRCGMAFPAVEQVINIHNTLCTGLKVEK